MYLFNVTKDYSNDTAINLADYLCCICDHDFDFTFMAGAQWLHSNGYSFWMIDLSELTYTKDPDSGPDYLNGTW